jgi:hypothetical protein
MNGATTLQYPRQVDVRPCAAFSGDTTSSLDADGDRMRHTSSSRELREYSSR